MEEKGNPLSGKVLTKNVDFKVGNSNSSFGWGTVGFAIYGRDGFAWLNSEDSGDTMLKDASNIGSYPAAFDAEYWLDNISVYDMQSSFVSEVFFVDGESMVKELPQSGTIMPRFISKTLAG